MQPRRITSASNPAIKEVASLRDARRRRERGQVLVDGSRDIRRALEAGWQIDVLVTCESHADAQLEDALETVDPASAVDWIEAPAAVHARVAYGESTKPVAVVRPKRWGWDDLLPPPDSRATIVVLDRVEKPGNVGAVLRCCDALGARGVVLSDPVCELYNPNAIRSSTGAIFTLPVLESEAVDTSARLVDARFSVFAARVEAAAEDYAAVDWPLRSAIVFGSEADGLGDRWQGASVRGVVIPMEGRVDSLNVSVAAAVVLSEISRRRRRVGAPAP